MIDHLMVMLNSLREIADEMGAVGLHERALPEAIRQYNEVLSRLCERESENVAWSIIKPLDADIHSASDLAISCAMIEKIVNKAKEEKRGPVMWHVRNRKHRQEIHSSYGGDIIVEPGCTLELHGSVKGNVILIGDACLECHGVVEGDVETDPESKIELHGTVSGSIVPRKSVEGNEVRRSSEDPV